MVKKKEKSLGIYETLDKDINSLIEETDDMEELLVLWKEEDLAMKMSGARVERIKNKIRSYLKERQWTRYDDASSKISVTLTMQKRESFDKKQLQMMLTEGQLAQVTRISTSEVMRIITPEARKRLKEMIK